MALRTDLYLGTPGSLLPLAPVFRSSTADARWTDVRAIRNPFNEPIVATAPDGRDVVGASDCWVVAAVGADGLLTGYRDIIPADTFALAYVPVRSSGLDVPGR